MPGLLADEPPVDVAIVGGGIVGLVLALGLIRRNVKVKIYEQARSFREIGAGVASTANAIQCMNKIEPDIVDAFRAVASSNGDSDSPNDWLQWLDGYNQPSKNPHEEKLLFNLYAGNKGFEGCHRAHFLEQLVKIIPDGVVEFRKLLDTLAERGPEEKLLLSFCDGITAEADVDDGTSDESGSQEAFAQWGSTVRAITDLMPEHFDKWAIFDTFDHPAPTYARGRICIVGDAAHASAPHHGAGACIGIEDALCLGTLMEMVVSRLQATGGSKAQLLSTAFETYNAVRRERSQWLVDSSRGICDVYHWNNPKTGQDPEKCFEEIKWRSHKFWYFDFDGMLADMAEGFERRLKIKEEKGIGAERPNSHRFQNEL